MWSNKVTKKATKSNMESDTDTWMLGKFRITAERHPGHDQTDKLPQDDGIIY